MSEFAIQARGLGKLYQIPESGSCYLTLRDTIVDSVTAPAKRLWGLLKGRNIAHHSGTRDFWAIRDVSFDVRRGEVLGIIGRNGSGKSTLLKLLSRITAPTEGRARVSGRIGSLLEVGTGFHFELSGRENVFLNGAMLGMKRSQIMRKFDEIVEFSQIGEFLDTPVKHYSSGMYMRLAFAVAAHLDSEILLVDEVLAVGDFDFQKKCLDKMHELTRSGRTVLFVSHGMDSVRSLCHRAMILSHGKLDAIGPAAEVIDRYMPPEAAAASSVEATPGSSLVQLLDVASVGSAGTAQTEFSFEEPVAIRIAYETVASDVGCRVRLSIRDPDNNLAFCAESQLIEADGAAEAGVRREQSPGQRFESLCRLPGHLLNNQEYSVSVQLIPEGSPTATTVKTDGATKFRVVDSTAQDDQRVRFLGPIRPKLTWHTSPSEAA